MDVLFALVQGDPVDIIVGIFVRFHTSGIAYESAVQKLNVSGFTSSISNPIKDHTAISYTTTKSSKVSLKIYDNMGRFIRTLVDKNEPAGTKTAYWDGKNNQRKKLPSGVYFIRFVVDAVGETQDYKDIKKVILLR
jgi:flagellar hook assembly protein FlgD